MTSAMKISGSGLTKVISECEGIFAIGMVSTNPGKEGSMQQQFAGFDARMLFECGGEMGDGGIAQHQGNFGNA